MKNHLLSLAALIALTSLPAAAQLVVGGTYNTGYVGNTAIAGGSADTNFTLTYTGPSAPANFGNPLVPNVGELPSGWVTATGAQFISPSANESYPPLPYEGGLPGDYDYHTTISNGFLVPTEITISGLYAADNTVEIEANGGVEVPFAATSPNSEFAGPLIPFSFSLLASPGVSTTLDFIVENYNSDNSDPFNVGTDGNLNPVGLLVSNLKVTASPEPSTWAMMFAGLGALVLAKRVRRAVTI